MHSESIERVTHVGQDFTGSVTEMVIRHLGHIDPVLVADALRAAEETRPIAVLTDGATWSSYAQTRRLLEAARPLLAAHGGLEAIGVGSMDDSDQPSAMVMMQDLGSLSAMFRDIGVMSSYISTVLTVESFEVGPTEWVIEQRFSEGFEPFAAYCELGAGLIAATPRLFGIPPATVTHEVCQRDGAPGCRYRVQVEVVDEDRQRADFFETRARLLESQIDTLQQTVGDLVSTDDLDEVLARIVASASTAVQAPSFVLAVEATHTVGRHVVHRGLTEQQAAVTADELLAFEPIAHAPSRLVVEVRSTRQHYGQLAAIRSDGHGFIAQELIVLEAYGRLAAVALDSAAALIEARRQTDRALALLDLSMALSETESIEETIAKVVEALPSVIDCDHAAIVIRDDGSGEMRLGATHGLTSVTENRLRRLLHSRRRYVVPGVLRDMLANVGCTGSIAAAIVLDGAPFGWLMAGVGDDRTRIETTDARARLGGLAAQAATAISNALRLDQIRHQALYDGLTGLPNRTLILDRVDQMLTRARRQRIPAAALFLDIDGFKDVNDTLGHDAGDQLLRAVAGRLANTLRQADTIGRLGGDEFVILVEGVSLDAGPELVAERLLDVLREPFALDLTDGEHVSLRVGASIGIAVGDRPSQLELLRDADVALYAAKASGKDCFVVFQPEMQTAVRDRIELETDIRNALTQEQYFLVYQPIVDLRSMQVTGVEALLRWRHPVRGIVQPNHFIPVLEDTSMIIDVGRWVLRDACRQTAVWQLDQRVDISVNVSAKQLETDGFVDDVRLALAESGIDPHSLILEITETAIMRDPDAVVRRLNIIKQLGCRIAIDDFGTGYSSLAYLSKFPVDCLKIDRSFIAAMSESPDAGALVNTLVQLGKTLGLETLAEGIEASAQVAYLQTQDCDSGQGFLFAEPLDVAAISELLLDQGLARLTATGID